MRIVIFTHEFPYPPNNGGRLDIYNRIKGLHLLGHEVFFIAWAIYEDNQKDESINAVKKLVKKLIVYKRKNNPLNRFLNLAEKLALLPIQPNIATECQLSSTRKKLLFEQIRLFNPDLYISDGVFAANITHYFSSSVKAPFYIRSHNIEHLYVKKQLSNATNLKAIFKLSGNYFSLKKYEFRAFSKADGILDISATDLEFWKKHGFKNIYWLPPVFFDNQTSDNQTQQVKLYDICYAGNLYNSNNVKAMFWFLNEVLPIIKQDNPHIKLCIAGSKPSKALIEACKKHDQITIKANPVDINIFYAQCKVFINPTWFGSGVNLKTIEQLFKDVPVVCTSVALTGLPANFAKIFTVADSSQDFAASIIKILKKKPDSYRSNIATAQIRSDLRSHFSAENLDQILKKIVIRK